MLISSCMNMERRILVFDIQLTNGELLLVTFSYQHFPQVMHYKAKFGISVGFAFPTRVQTLPFPSYTNQAYVLLPVANPPSS